MRVLLALLLSAGLSLAQSVQLSDSQALEIGKRIWKNECAGTVSGLTSWNKGEDFASLGIGHFIWYHSGSKGPFEESFPKLAAYLASHGKKVPDWMRGPCPWTSRAQFVADSESPPHGPAPHPAERHHRRPGPLRRPSAWSSPSPKCLPPPPPANAKKLRATSTA